MFSKNLILAVLSLTFLVGTVTASTTTDNKFSHHAYAGISSGYGSTLWSGLVPPQNRVNATLLLSAPVTVAEGGTMWGFFAGYEFIPEFAIETSYTRYPLAKISFTQKSLFTFQNKGRSSFSTITDDYSFVGKFMVIIPHSSVRGYANAGVAAVHRADIDTYVNHWRASPTFGIGINYNLTERVMAELGANYTAGYGESELTPASDYVPFLYSIFLRVGYRFG